jgi:capsular polysaccharide transport system permease protein
MKIGMAWMKPGTLLLILAWLLAASYWYGVASERYLSEAKFVVQRTGAEAGGSLSMSSLLGGAGLAASNDALMLKEYIASSDLYDQLDSRLGLRKHYSDPSRDYISRLLSDAPREEYYRYLDDKITVSYDDVSAVLSVSAEAYTPAMAQEIVEEIVHQSESFINGVGFRLAREQVEFASLQLVDTREGLEKATNEMLGFQNQHGMLSPEVNTKSVSEIISKMEAELATARAKLTSLKSYLSDSAQEVIAARAKVRALERQIRKENQKLVGAGSEKNDKLNALNAKFEKLKMEAKFRSDTYGSALTVFEAARIEASHKLKHLVVIESPALPEEAAYPRKLYDMVTFIVLSTLMFWIFRLGIATVKDHRD